VRASEPAIAAVELTAAPIGFNAAGDQLADNAQAVLEQDAAGEGQLGNGPADDGRPSRGSPR
jgi:hypothetical protein